MGYRLSKIYTKTGDDGTTALADGSRVGKEHALVHSMGDIDELNSLLGLLIVNDIDEDIKEYLLDIQHILFDIGGELSMPESQMISMTHTEYLEEVIERYNSSLPPLKEFILPGGSLPAAICHLARSVCRRAERQLISLSKQTVVNQASLILLNRLSDLLFVLARTISLSKGNDEIYWQSKRLSKKYSK